jgi:hypothetical protein
MVRKLTREQAAIINRALYPLANYLIRLRRRMERVGFLPDDPFFCLVAKAQDALQHLTVTLHYRSCPSGVGESESKTKGEQ